MDRPLASKKAIDNPKPLHAHGSFGVVRAAHRHVVQPIHMAMQHAACITLSKRNAMYHDDDILEFSEALHKPATT